MHEHFNLNGKLFDLSHLNRVKSRANARLRNGYIKQVSVDLAFSCHCYSRMPIEDELIPSGFLIKDGSEEVPRDRIFSESRYELSKLVPLIIQDILDNGKIVHETKYKNVVCIEMLAPFWLLLNMKRHTFSCD